MKPASLLFGALALIPSALAVGQTKSAIVWFDDPATPDSIVNEAKDNIIAAGGKITHVYNIIKYVWISTGTPPVRPHRCWAHLGRDTGVYGYQQYRIHSGAYTESRGAL